ncbi:hypothetical protein LCGC14_2898390 [marine sediment metagenome]|uniref:Uncharacterized protein n=1 Tax=marine sediment metagenome TaxID=412755 RepID=A0A0F8XV62_9ZZZZ
MLTGTIELTGKTTSELELAAQEATKKIAQGYLGGSDSNDDGAYFFKVSGEEKPNHDTAK